MAQSFTTVPKGASFRPQLGEPGNPENGDIYVDSDLGLRLYFNDTWKNIPKTDQVKATFINKTNTALPSVAPFLVDGIAVEDGDKVLFTNLTVGANRVYKATVEGSSIDWAVQSEFSQSFDADLADTVRIEKGVLYASSEFIFDGINWIWIKLNTFTNTLGSEEDPFGDMYLKNLNLAGLISGSLILQAADTTIPYTLKLPSAQGGVNDILVNDGNGNLSWFDIPSLTANVSSVNGQDGAVVLDTDDINEGNNKYYSSSLFNADLNSKTTDDITEGNNLYYTDGRVDSRISSKTTDDITEGNNLYYTDGRVSTNSNVAANTAKISADGSISTHSDVDLTGIQNDDILVWSGSGFVPGQASGGGILFKSEDSLTETFLDPIIIEENTETVNSQFDIIVTQFNLDDVYAQTFTANNSGDISNVIFYCNNQPKPNSGTIKVELRAVTADIPTSTVLATSDEISWSSFDPSLGLMQFVFSNTVELTNGTKYAFVFISTHTPSFNNFRLLSSFSTTYVNGSYLRSDDSEATWTANPPNWNLIFTVNGTVDTAYRRSLELEGFTSGKVYIGLPDTVTDYQLKLPSQQGNSYDFLSNDGSGNLSWQPYRREISEVISATWSRGSAVSGIEQVEFYRVGKSVTVRFTAFNNMTGNSASGAIVFAQQAPDGFKPAEQINALAAATDRNIISVGLLEIQSGGNIILFKNANRDSFLTNGAGQFFGLSYNTTITYLTEDPFPS